MEQIFEWGLGIILISIIWFAMSGMICLILDATPIKEGVSLRDYIAINIRLPKRSRFLTKVDPIYELVSTWNGWVIRKWSLEYSDNSFAIAFFSLFLVYPVNFYRYTYVEKDTIYLPQKTKVADIDKSLKEIYEEQWLIENADRLAEEAKQKAKEDKIDKLNKIFIENYEA